MISGCGDIFLRFQKCVSVVRDGITVAKASHFHFLVTSVSDHIFVFELPGDGGGQILHRFRHYPAGTGRHKYFQEPYRICACTDVTLIPVPEWGQTTLTQNEGGNHAGFEQVNHRIYLPLEVMTMTLTNQVIKRKRRRIAVMPVTPG